MDQVLTTQSSPQHTQEPDLSASDSAEDMEVNLSTEVTSDESSTSAVTSSSEDSDFIPVSHKRQRTTSIASSAHGTEDAGEASSANSKDYCGTFRIIPKDYASEMEVLALLFCEYPKLECARRQINNRSVLLLSKTKQAYDILSATTRLNGKSVKFELMGEKQNLRTGVLHYVPPFISEQAILSMEKIISASRILRWDPSSQQKVPTEMIKFQYDGPLPATIRLGVCGNFKVRPFVPQPTRCYKCQRYGHVATTCNARSARCRLCAGTHLTEQCQTQRNSGQSITLKCANCGDSHPASSGLCPKLRDITQTMRTRAATKFKPTGAPKTNAWSNKNSGKRATVPQHNTQNVATNNSGISPTQLTPSATNSNQSKRTTPYIPLGLPKPVSSLPAKLTPGKKTATPAIPPTKTYADSAKPNVSNPPPSNQAPQPMDIQEKEQQNAIVKAVVVESAVKTGAPETTNLSTAQATNSMPQSPEEDLLIDLINNAIDMAKRDLDIIQGMMIRNLKTKNSQIKEYLQKQNQKIMTTLNELGDLM